MLTSTLTSAAAMGLLGGLHCAAMCGPIAITACSGQTGLRGRATFGYLTGRFVAYASLGAASGAFGAFVDRSTFEGARLALIFAVAMWFVVKGVRIFTAARARTEGLVHLQKRRVSSAPAFGLLRLPARGAGLGLLTGILPCGLLYAGFSLAAATGAPGSGALVMFVLASATLPGLFAPLLMRRAVEKLPLLRAPRAQGALWCLFGLWLSVRPVVALFEHRGCHG